MKWSKDRKDAKWGPFLVRQHAYCHNTVFAVNFGHIAPEDGVTPGLHWIWGTGYCDTIEQAHLKAEKWMKKQLATMQKTYRKKK